MSLTIASVADKQRIFTLTGLAHEVTGVKVVQKKGKQTVSLKLAKKEKKTWHKLLDEASTEEAVAENTKNSNTSITSRVRQTTLIDFSKNVEKLSPAEKEVAIDDQIRSMDSHGIQCGKEYWSDLRADTGTLFVPDKIVMEQHNSTPSPSQSCSKESSGFEERVGDSINDQNSKPTVNPGRRSTVMEFANDSTFSGEHHNCSKFSQHDGYQKSADDDRTQADDNMNGVRPEADTCTTLRLQK